MSEIHWKDRNAANPRIQCSVCGQWKRLNRRKEHPRHPGFMQNFYGSCDYTGDSHRASNGEVCVECCDKHCATPTPRVIK